MDQSLRLSKNQLRNLKRKAAKEIQKKQQQQEEPSSSSEGKVMVGPIEIRQPKNEAHQKLQTQLDQMQKLISKYEETTQNQGEKIRELMNNIEDQNNELLILRRQLIQSNLITEEQL